MTYQDVTVALPPEVVTFDVEQTVQQSNSGQENPIISKVSVDGLRTILIQQFPSIIFNDESIRSIASGIEKELGTGIMPLNVHITDYSDFAKIEIAESSIDASELSTSFAKLINSLNGIIIAPFSTFSLLDYIQNNNVGPVSDEELTVLASVLYSTVLETNFVVDERNIGSMLAPLIEPGYEAAVNSKQGLNFIFTNPNKSSFALHVESVGEAIQSSINGMPLLNTYLPYIGQIESFEPKTVQQFSAFVPYGQVRVADKGRKGMEVNVHRTISYEGTVVVDEVISSDFYTPQPKIEILPLKREAMQTSGTVDSQGNSIPADPSGAPNSGDSSTPQTGKNPSQGLDGDTGVDNEEVRQDVQYDKGGNIIK